MFKKFLKITCDKNFLIKFSLKISQKIHKKIPQKKFFSDKKKRCNKNVKKL